VVLEIDLTPNRSDCMSVAGVARETAAILGARFTPVRVSKARLKTRKRLAVNLLARKECPRYAGRVLQNINMTVVTPCWMRERLRRAGVRSIHPVVDVMNYVMLELGQPMHAFDLAKLKGGVKVRPANAGEVLTLLDGRRLELPTGSLLIADGNGPIALAGIMGGQDTAVSSGSKDVFLESAFFRPEAIAGRARSVGLHTESSQRFERGVDPALQTIALERATELLVGIVGGEPGPITEVGAKMKSLSPIRLRRQRLERVLGISVPGPEVERVLERSGMKLRRQSHGWEVTPPSYRFDQRIEADLIEEVARLYGYERIPARVPHGPMVAPEIPETRLDVGRLRRLLMDRDYQEVVTYSFVDPELQRVVDPATPALTLANPISADMAVMRTTLWPGLLQTLRYNRNRQLERIRIFETGRRFSAGTKNLPEQAVITGAACGSAAGQQWGLAKREVDYYDVKADVEELFHLSGDNTKVKFVPALHPALHPGQSAAIHCGEQHVGWVGTLHPQLQAQFELGRVILFEIELAALTTARLPVFAEISKFPAIRRDVAVVVEDAVTAHQVLQAVRKDAGELLVNLELFDEYRGEGIDSGRKSLALGLTLQHSSRTLKEVEVDALITQVITKLKTELGAELRQ
jgi:phenylalanyl-tRNA synthetase beta chain